ncbi:MAG TPA: response regulator [Cyanobacteria bacterium UBA11049]|nr:response regulator [Cyanobacteria bacterium UBA11049]
MKKILVIEDDFSVRANILDLLEAEDFNAIGAENGFIGALWAQQHLPDLIICDVMMPEVDGYEVLNALRSQPTTATIPFIFLTAMADKSNIRYGMELGADDYVTKPFTQEELLKAIATRFAKQDAVMHQYIAEHQRAEALEQKIKELQQYVDANDGLLQQFQQKLNSIIPKLNIAIHLIKILEPGEERDRGLAILQATCAEEITLLNQIPNLKDLLTCENLALLRQLNIVS